LNFEASRILERSWKRGDRGLSRGDARQDHADKRVTIAKARRLRDDNIVAAARVGQGRFRDGVAQCVMMERGYVYKVTGSGLT